MTWDEFVAAVEAQLAARGVDRQTRLEAIDWSAGAFGGPTPAVFVNVVPRPDGPALLVTED